jgi:UDPglucose--hexose-1-phosphate uridylyltransferase
LTADTRNWSDLPHRRLNPLTGEWVLVSPHRTRRPWQGKRETVPAAERPAYDSSCYLCPGNARAGGAVNPDYRGPYVFTNDFAALLPETAPAPAGGRPLFRHEPVPGACRVVCYSPRHDLTMAEMEVTDIRRVVTLWADQVADLGRTYPWVQVFENKGEMMGCSNPHPHGQIWAGTAMPNEPFKEDLRQREYWARERAPLLLAAAEYEAAERVRIVVENEHWLAFVPFWAVWPFETLLVPRSHRPRLTDLPEEERDSLAALLKRLLVRYDNLFETSFPYTMGWHGAPTGGGDHPHWQLHAHFYPPLLRSATVRKFMVGYEMLAEAQRDITPEQAAERLAALPDVHWKAGPAGKPSRTP